MAGLAGFPFTGKSGFSAFSSQCPKDGNIVILFAPHVGIDSNGAVGKVKRGGHESHSAASGAAFQALEDLLKNNGQTSGNVNHLDYQMDCIKQLLAPHLAEISTSENMNVSLVYKVFQLIQEFLEGIYNTNWMTSKSKLAIIGGIVINMEGEGSDLFLPLKFEVRTL